MDYIVRYELWIKIAWKIIQKKYQHGYSCINEENYLESAIEMRVCVLNVVMKCYR